MIEKKVVITPPEYTLSPEGKLLPVAHVSICEVLTENGVQIGKTKPHRCCLVLMQDGTWAFEPHPVHPVTGLPFVFDAATRNRWDATLAVLEVQYGVVDHKLNDDTTVKYVQGGDGNFSRVVTKAAE